MEIKTLNIFIGSSVGELQHERDALDSFFTKFNNDYEDRYNIRVKPYRCEDQGTEMVIGGKQEEYNSFIKQNADKCIFMFYRKAGKFTKEEVKIAADTLRENQEKHQIKKPNVYIYFKDYQEGTEAAKYANELYEEYSHYWGEFTNIDTVKLEILTSLVDEIAGTPKLEVKDGKITLDEKVITDIDLQNITVYIKNDDYKKQKRIVSELKERCADALQNKGCGNFMDLAKALDQEQKNLQQMESDMFSILKTYYKEKQRKDANELVLKAYQLLEEGQIEKARELIPITYIKKENAEYRENKLQDARTRVAVARAGIDTEKIDIYNPDRFQHIEEIYADTWEIAIDAEDYEFIFDGIWFCCFQMHDAGKSIEILDAVIPLAKNEKTTARYYFLYGMVLNSTQSKQEAAKKFLKAIEIDEQILLGDHSYCFDVEDNLAASYRHISNIYRNWPDRYIEAENYALKAIEIRQKHFDEGKERIEKLAAGYNTISLLYYEEKNYTNAKQYAQCAIKKMEDQYNDNSDDFISVLAGSYQNIAAVYHAEDDYPTAKEYYSRAIDTIKQLYDINPARFGAGLARSYNNIATVYSAEDDLRMAKEYYSRAIDIRKQLYDINPEQFGTDLADSYNNIANVYYDEADYPTAKEYHSRAIDIKKQLYDINPEQFGADLAASYHGIAYEFYDKQNFRDAEEYYKLAIDIGKTLYDINPKLFGADLAASYHDIANVYRDEQNFRNAEEYYKQAIDIEKKMYDWFPLDYFGRRLANSYYAIAAVYQTEQDFFKAEEYYNLATGIEMLYNTDPET